MLSSFYHDLWQIAAHRQAVEAKRRADNPAACGILFRLSSFWVGAHWSPYNRRWCINLIPCVTVWITRPGGYRP